MARPVFHERTQAGLLRFAKHLPHAIGLEGSVGIGLLTAAEYVATHASAETIIVYPEKKEAVDREAGTITIDIVRRLYDLTRGRRTTPRCIIVTAADTMSHEAQNAFLKLLEEPTAHTSFVLLIHDATRLLPTVLSRLQVQQVQKITTEQSELLLDRLKVTDIVRRKQLLFIAGGLPARLTKLASEDALFEAEATLLRHARSLIQGSAYERLLVAHTIKGSRADALSVVQYAIEILRFDSMAKKFVSEDVARLLNRLERALVALGSNGNVRLTLADVALSSALVV